MQKSSLQMVQGEAGGKRRSKVPWLYRSSQCHSPRAAQRGFVSADERSLWSSGILTGSISYLAIFMVGAMKIGKEGKDRKGESSLSQMGKGRKEKKDDQCRAELVRGYDFNAHFSLPHPSNFWFKALIKIEMSSLFLNFSKNRGNKICPCSQKLIHCKKHENLQCKKCIIRQNKPNTIKRTQFECMHCWFLYQITGNFINKFLILENKLAFFASKYF